MWTYRIDDADDADIEVIAGTFEDSDYPITKGIVKASGQTYVVMFNGKDWAWFPTSVGREPIQRFCKMKNENTNAAWKQSW